MTLKRCRSSPLSCERERHNDRAFDSNSDTRTAIGSYLGFECSSTGGLKLPQREALAPGFAFACSTCASVPKNVRLRVHQTELPGSSSEPQRE